MDKFQQTEEMLRGAQGYSLVFRLAQDRLLAFAVWRSEEFDPEATGMLRLMVNTRVVSKDGLLRLWDLWESYHNHKGAPPPSLLE